MGFLDNHQYSAVTSIVNDCCAEAQPGSEDGYVLTQLGPLMEAIKHQTDFAEPGPVEAARAIRKKLKYGSTREQYNALQVLDLLVVNGGPKLKMLYDDDKLNDRLQVVLIGDGAKEGIHPKVRKYAFELMEGWAQEYGSEPEMAQLVTLYKRCRKNQKLGARQAQKRKSQVPDFMNDQAADMDEWGEERPRTNAELDKKFRIPRINLVKEKPKILDLIGRANVQSTNLANALDSLAPEELAIHSLRANECFDQCRSTRRIILRYLQLVSAEDLLGPLLKCNDEIVAVLKRYEELSRVPDDSDNDSLADLQSYGASSLAMTADDSDDNDDYYARRGERYPPAESYEEPEPVMETRRPPPVPPKKSVLREQKIDPQAARAPPKKATPPKVTMAKPSRTPADDYNPFSDDNEVAPSAWS